MSKINTTTYILICIVFSIIIGVIIWRSWQPRKDYSGLNRKLLNKYGITDEEINILGHEALVLQDLLEQNLVDKGEVDALKRGFLDKLYNPEALREDVINLKAKKNKEKSR